MSKKSNGKIWPYAISISIFLVVIAGIITISVAIELPVQDSDRYMMGYHEADAKANELIEAKIAFDKKYTLSLITDTLHVESTQLQYKLIDKDNNAIDDAKISLMITRPNTHKYDFELTSPSVKDGIYTFSNVKLAVEGRWNIMAKINVDDNARFYNVKMDTRSKGAYEY